MIEVGYHTWVTHSHGVVFSDKEIAWSNILEGDTPSKWKRSEDILGNGSTANCTKINNRGNDLASKLRDYLP